MTTALEHIEAAHKSLLAARELAAQMRDAEKRKAALALIDEQIKAVKATFDEVGDEEGE